MYEQFRARETEVLIIGGGSRKGAERLSARLKLPFPVLVNPDRAVYRRYGLDKVLIALQRSGTFLIDKQGIVRYIHQGHQSPGFRGERGIDARGRAII